MSNDCGSGPMSLILSAIFLASTIFLSSVSRVVETTRRCLFHFERIDGVVTPGFGGAGVPIDGVVTPGFGGAGVPTDPHFWEALSHAANRQPDVGRGAGQPF